MRNLTLCVPCIILQCVNDQRDAQILIINFYSTVFFLLYMFQTNLVVHHQEHYIIYCITQFGTIGTVVQASLDSPARLNRLYCVIQYIMPCS